MQSASRRSGGSFDIEGKRDQIRDLDRQASLPEFWEDSERAQKVLKEKGQIERVIDDWDGLSRLKDDIATLIELGEEENDASLAGEAEGQLDLLEQRLRSLEIRRILAADEDRMDAVLEINAGAGGTDAADWAGMLLRMYGRWAERHGFTTELLDVSEAELAGIRSAVIAIRGSYAFGYLQAESGVHRLVRISPFDKDQRRQTAFASVAAYPEIDDTIHIDLNPADIEMEAMRASGAGGQSVNTTDSAVRLRHLPTGIVVVCRAEKSQHKNRDKAMKMLKAKLYQLEMEKRLASQAEINAKKKKIDFGSQIRSYVMQPYQQVKDMRTGQSVADIQRVLDGDLDRFMEAWLAARAEGTLAEA